MSRKSITKQNCQAQETSSYPRNTAESKNTAVRHNGLSVAGHTYWKPVCRVFSLRGFSRTQCHAVLSVCCIFV